MKAFCQIEESAKNSKICHNHYTALRFKTTLMYRVPTKKSTETDYSYHFSSTKHFFATPDPISKILLNCNQAYPIRDRRKNLVQKPMKYEL